VHDDPSWSQVVDVMDYLPSDFWNTAEWVRRSLSDFQWVPMYFLRYCSPSIWQGSRVSRWLICGSRSTWLCILALCRRRFPYFQWLMRVLVLVLIMRYKTLDKFLTCSLVVVVSNWLVLIFL
jgi:hypothetical protein